MRYATFSLPNDAHRRIGLAIGSLMFDLEKLVGQDWVEPFPRSLHEFIQAGPEAWRRVVLRVKDTRAQSRGEPMSYPLEQVRLHAPIPRPAKNIVCLGLNYVTHLEETARARGRQAKIPEVPVFFTKAPTAVNGPFDPIRWDRSATATVDWEAELGVVIGIGGRDISRARALEHVFGYTVINDLSARDLQQQHYQWFKGKSLDGFCPMGPVLVTAEEFGDPQQKQVSLRVNGVVKQSASTADMIFPVAVIIEYLSRGMTLEAGDVISTGTPEGVGLGRTPPEYLKDGDWVETEVEGIGLLRNQIVAVEPPSRSMDGMVGS